MAEESRKIGDEVKRTKRNKCLELIIVDGSDCAERELILDNSSSGTMSWDEENA